MLALQQTMTELLLHSLIVVELQCRVRCTYSSYFAQQAGRVWVAVLGLLSLWWFCGAITDCDLQANRLFCIVAICVSWDSYFHDVTSEFVLGKGSTNPMAANSTPIRI